MRFFNITTIANALGRFSEVNLVLRAFLSQLSLRLKQPAVWRLGAADSQQLGMLTVAMPTGNAPGICYLPAISGWVTPTGTGRKTRTVTGCRHGQRLD